MRSIFLSGASGFIGKNIKEYFENKYNIFAPNRDELNLLDFKSVREYFNKIEVDFIIHCASYGVTRFEGDIYNKNILMYKNLKSILNNNTKMISFGSGAQYDRSKNLINISEKLVNRPSDEYGLSKYEIARDILETNKKIISLNIFGCYGKYEDLKRFISYVCLNALKNKEIIIKENNTFSYLYIQDLLKILDYILGHHFPNHKIINCTPDIQLSMQDIVKQLNKIKKVKYKILKNGRYYSGDNTLLKNIICDLNFTNIEAGLNDMLQYHRDINLY